MINPKLSQARMSADLAEKVYLPFDSWQYNAVYGSREEFQGPTTALAALCTDEAVVVAVRGTVKLKTADDLLSWVQGWARNLDFRQMELKGFNVHCGFGLEARALLPTIKQMIMDLGGEKKRVYLTGHSAGGALASLLGYLLQAEGIPINGCYTFGSPRVGDRRWANAVTFPLHRFEYGNDLISHLPLSPLARRMLERVAATTIPTLTRLVPGLFANDFEYVHAGTLNFVSTDGYIASPVGVFEFAEAVLSARTTRFDVVPLPHQTLSYSRFLGLGAAILEGGESLFQDHGIRHVRGFLTGDGPAIRARDGRRW